MGIDWTSILNQILAVLVPTVIAALGLLGMIVLNRLRTWAAASEAVAKDALSKSVAKQAIYAAEEKSASNEKAGLGPDSKVQKEVNATAFMQERIPDKPVTEIPGDIKASLGATKGLGASVTPEIKA
jgi:xanthosine utilization system XapX-like protein